jgi:fluoroacetyl-CoA thioesterase
VKNTLEPGLAGESRHVVTADMAPRHLLPRVVLSTPSMIQLLEQTCLETAAEHLDEGETTVGTHVCVSHQAAASADEEVVIRCRLTRVERRRLSFDVEVDGPRGRISEGTHERAVVALDRLR